MTLSPRSVLVLVGMVVLCLLAMYVWPTVWTYPQGQVVNGTQILSVSVRVNRFTGKTQFLSIGGWANPVFTPNPTPTPAVPAAPAGPQQ